MFCLFAFQKYFSLFLKNIVSKSVKFVSYWTKINVHNYIVCLLKYSWFAQKDLEGELDYIIRLN